MSNRLMRGIVPALIGIIFIVGIGSMVSSIDKSKLSSTETDLVGVVPIVFAAVVILGIVQFLGKVEEDSPIKLPNTREVGRHPWGSAAKREGSFWEAGSVHNPVVDNIWGIKSPVASESYWS